MSSVCRVCLTGGGNVTLSSLEDVRLKDVYRKLTNTQFNSNDGRPRVVCCYCHQDLLISWTLSEMARRSENIFSDLLCKGLEATHDTIENLNLGTKQHLYVAPMRYFVLDNETLMNSCAIFIKEEPITVKEEETVPVDEFVDNESADTHISRECIENQLIFEEDSKKHNYLIENCTEIDILQQNHETDTEILGLDQEKIEVHPDKLNTFCCDICSKMFLDRSRLVSHIQLSHTKDQQCKIFDNVLGPKRVHTGDKTHSCSVCDKQFIRKSDLVRHMRIHTGEKPYACSICGKQCNQKWNLITHMRIHTGVKPNACSKRDRQCQLVQHNMRIHTGEKPYACSVCDKKFIQKSHLATHMRIHTLVKPFTCGMCDKQFIKKSDLVRHMRIHTGEKPYACSICGKQFTQKWHLATHMRIHTGVEPNVTHTCGMCDKQFIHKSALIRHMRIHIGVKPCACSTCDKQFIHKSDLVRHMTIHTGVKPYVCSICDKQFNRKYNLVKHMNIHNGEKP